MTWKVWATDYETTGAMEDASIYQPIKMNRNVILRAVRLWIVAYNNPTYDSLNLKIYSNEVVNGINTARKLLHTSTDVRTKAEIQTLGNAVKEIYFTFDHVPLRGEDIYNFVLNASGYAPVAPPSPSASVLAWRKAFPDPIYNLGFTPAIDVIERCPYSIYFIGAEA